ncbi:hypothetical protein COE99_27790 [Bacillus toyonensis]|uniref:hypothetical protein n=1 Tax=Bacillus toyonensis TaxID=155322 RepID=UPI000BFB2F12|nr:hypothetical protein [Bacillus toyonensis]PHC01199.1 hypothetical protein COE99_27790 [Bacillus toyonensis]
MKKNKIQNSYYIREYTLRDKSIKSIKVEPWRSFKEEMKVLGIDDSAIFQIQLIEKRVGIKKLDNIK